MIGRWPGRSLRTRLGAWYALTVFVILAVYGVGSFKFVHENLSHDLDRRLRGDMEMAETMIERRPDGTLRWLGPTHHHGDSEEIDHVIWVEAWSPSGSLEYRSELPEQVAAGLATPASQEYGLKRSTVDDGLHLRYLEKEFPVGGSPTILRVIRSEEDMRTTVAHLMLAGLLGIPFAVLLAAAGGSWMAGRALKPVERMAEEARSISADRLHTRLPVHDPDDELGQLATVFNETLGRLERSFEQLRQFTSDVSHELRTPLTSIRSVGEVALQRDRDGARQRWAIGSMLEEAERLSQLVDRLLTLSRADAGRIHLDRRPLDLGALVRDVATDLAVLAEEKRQSLQVNVEGQIPVLGDAAMLQVALVNLVHNAVLHCPPGASIVVEARREDGRAVVDVRDDGPGIPAPHRERVFDRFYRVDQSRTRSTGGSGLGLAIARWAVEAHGGTLALEAEDDRGCTMRLRMPVSSRPAEGSVAEAPPGETATRSP